MLKWGDAMVSGCSGCSGWSGWKWMEVDECVGV